MLTPLMALAPLLLLLLGLEVSQRLWRLLVQLAGPMSFGGAMCRSTIVGGVGFLFVVLPLVVIEHLFPASRLSMRSYAIGMAGWPIAWALSYVVGIAEQALIGRLSVTPLLVVHGNAHRTGVAIALIFVSMFVFDFFYYWFHRMQHSIPALWRLHAVHHSIRELNAVMSFHHPLEALLRIIPVTLPLALLVRFDDMPVIPIVSAFVGCWGQFIHTDTRVSLGQGRVLLADNHFHRIHHSERKEHHNKNFAAYFPLWDRLFGTVHMPVRGEYPPVGLTERPDGMTMRDFFLGVPTSRSAAIGTVAIQTRRLS